MNETNAEEPRGVATASCAATGTAMDFDHPKFFPCQCPKCGWRGMSDETEGGNPIADTGDFNDIVCPVCFKNQEWIAVEEIKKPNNLADFSASERKP